MNPIAVRPRTAGARATTCRLAVWLLPAVVASASSPGFATPPVAPLTRPYLAVLGSTPLRIAEAIPPPDLSSRPGKAAPPNPEPEEVKDSLVSHEPAKPDVILGPASAMPAEVPTPERDATPAKSPPPILLDDSRPRVKPEDFLPFFVFPGSGESTTVVVPVTVATPPVPGTLPPSSATYRQQ